MALSFNGNTPSKIKFNNNNVSKVVFNGNTVWEKSSGFINIFDLSKIEFSGNVTKTESSIIFDNSTTKTPTYYNSTSVDSLGLKPNTTYSTKAKITYEIIQEGGNSAGSMEGCIFLQKTANYSYDDKYAIVGKSYAKTEIIYNKFTTPSDLTGYDYLVARASGYKKMTFEDIVIIEGNYDESNFPNV